LDLCYYSFLFDYNQPQTKASIFVDLA